MRDDWQSGVLGDFIELKRGYDLPKRMRNAGHYPIVSSSGVTGTHAEAKVKGPGVVTGRYGTIGEVFYLEHDFWPLNTTLYVRDFKGNDVQFISYFLKTFDYSAYSDKAAVPGVNRNHLHQAEVSIPPLKTQRKIAETLSAIDHKIELNHKTARTLEELAQRLFKSWFVDFDPVHAKMAGRQPAHTPPEIADLFPDRLVESPLGAIPEGWTRAELREIIDLNPTEPLKKGVEALYVGMAALPTEGMSIEGAFTREYNSGSRFRSGDTLMARITPCLENGKGALFLHEQGDRPAWGSTEFIVLRAREPVPQLWPYLLTRDVGFREFAIQNMTGTSGRQRVSAEAVARYSLPVPPSEVFEAFGLLVNGFCDRIEQLRQESATLARLRDLLLPRLIRGDVRIPYRGEK